MPQIVTLEVDLNAPVTIDRLSSALPLFFRWWAEQLIDIAPASWRRAFQSLVTVTRLDVRQTLWTLFRTGGNELAATLDSSQSDEDLKRSFARLFPEGLSSSAEIILPSDVALIRRISVPAAASTRLRSVARLQLDRLSPFRGEDVLFDCRLVNPGEMANAECPVDIAILPKATLHLLENRLRQIGVVPSRFRIGDTGFAVKASGIRWTPQRQKQALLLMAAGIVWGSFVWLEPIMRDNEIASLQTEIAALAPEATHAEEIRQALGRYQLPPAALSANRARSLDILLILTRTLPDEVHLTSATFTDTNLRLQGHTPSNIGILPLLARTGLFEKKGVTGSQVRDQFTVSGVLRIAPVSGAASFR